VKYRHDTSLILFGNIIWFVQPRQVHPSLSMDELIASFKGLEWENREICYTYSQVAGPVVTVFQPLVRSKLSYVSELNCKNVIPTSTRSVGLATEERISRSFSSRASHFLELWSAPWLLSPVLLRHLLVQGFGFFSTKFELVSHHRLQVSSCLHAWLTSFS